MNWFSQNIGTLVILSLLAALVAAIVGGMVKKKKAGVSTCGCGCSDCPMKGKCH